MRHAEIDSNYSARTSCTLAVLASALVAGCSGYGGDDGQPAPPPDITMNVQPASILAGGSATLTWSTDAAATCDARGGWTGNQPTAGTLVVAPTVAGTIDFTLICTSPGGGRYGAASTASRTATLTVNESTTFSRTVLLADTADAVRIDRNLVNPWGIAVGPVGPAWIANHRTATATLYDGAGNAAPAVDPLVVNFPTDAGGASFAPTGIVFNGSGNFVVTAGELAAPALFLFAGERGSIAGWSPAVDLENASVTYTDDRGAVYKGLALATDGTEAFLYATDFFNNRVDVFDSAFRKQPATADRFAFSDPTLPAGYAAFGIQSLPTGAGGAPQLYVTYARQLAPDNRDSVAGAGLGLVNVFDTSGRLVRHLIPAGGSLNAPWGIALAPPDLGVFANALLVGNFGDGQIHAFNLATSEELAALRDSAGGRFTAPGLRGIAFGNDHVNQPHDALFFTAGPNDAENGAYGRLDVGATPPNLHQAPAVTLTAPAAGEVQGTVAVTANVVADATIASVEFFADRTSLGVVTTAPFTVEWDTSDVPNGPVLLTARARDVDGNVDTGVTGVLVAN